VISYRQADLLEEIREEREVVRLIIVINDETIYLWAYDSENNQIEFENFVMENIRRNCFRELERSFTIVNPTYPFNPRRAEFTQQKNITPTKQSMLSRTLDDLFKCMKRADAYFVGESEYHANEFGTFFGIIEVYKPKFALSDHVKFIVDGETKQGLVIGIDGSDGRYTISCPGEECDIKENDLLRADQ